MCCGFADLFNCRVAKLRLARRLDLYLLYLCLHEAPNGKEGAAGKGRRDSRRDRGTVPSARKQRKQGLGRQVGASRLGGGPTGGLPGPRPSLATVPSGAAGASRPEPSRSADAAKIPASSSSGGRAPCRRAALHSALLTRPCPAVSGQVSAPPSVQEQPLDL